MSSNLSTSITGNVAKIDARITSSGDPVINLTVASDHRRYDPQTKEWATDSTTFLECNIWGQLAKNVKNTIIVGDTVLVTGNLHTNEWLDKETQTKRSKLQLKVESIGLSLQWRPLDVRRPEKAGNSSMPVISPDGRPLRTASASRR